MTKLLRESLSVCAFALVVSAPAFADPVLTNGNFATGDFSGWNLSGDSGGDYISIGQLPGYQAALTTDTGDNGNLSQTFTDISSQDYTLTFLFGGDGATPNSLAVSIDSTQLFSSSNIGDTIPTGASRSLSFIGTGTDTVNFIYDDAPGYLYLTDVAVTPVESVVPSATPEPSSLMLLGTGIAGIASALSRRKR